MTIKEIAELGLLKLYVMGELKGTDRLMIERALSKNESLAKELGRIEQTLLLDAQINAMTPSPTVKPLLMAKVDYMERLRQGEIADVIPVLDSHSSIEDFNTWLNRSDMQLQDDFDEAQVKIIAIDDRKMTAIVWLKSGAPPETHSDEYEKFLIIEGTCELTIGDQIHKLGVGGYLTIPLHQTHHVRVTSPDTMQIYSPTRLCISFGDDVVTSLAFYIDVSGHAVNAVAKTMDGKPITGLQLPSLLRESCLVAELYNSCCTIKRCRIRGFDLAR